MIKSNCFQIYKMESYTEIISTPLILIATLMNKPRMMEYRNTIWGPCYMLDQQFVEKIQKIDVLLSHAQKSNAHATKEHC